MRHYARLQQEFHRDHQLNWVDDLCDAIEDVALSVFYVGLADVTRGFVHAETETIADEAALVDELAGACASAVA